MVMNVAGLGVPSLPVMVRVGVPNGSRDEGAALMISANEPLVDQAEFKDCETGSKRRRV